MTPELCWHKETTGGRFPSQAALCRVAFVLLPYLFHRLMCLPQMFSEGALRTKGEKEVNARGRTLLSGMDMDFEILDLYDHPILVGKGFYASGPMGA